MTAHLSHRSWLSAVLAILISTSLGAGHPAHAAKKKHHKKHAPSGKTQKSSAPDTGAETEESPEPSSSSSSSSSGGSSESSEESKPARETESSSGGGEEAAPAPKRKKVKMEGEAAAQEPTAPSGLPWLEISIGIAGMNRNLSFHQDADPVGNQLNPYSLPFWPVGVASAVFYLEPLIEPLGNLGFEFQGMQGFGVSSKFSNSSSSYSSTVHDYSGGARYRFPFGAANAFHISARYGEDAFTFSGAMRGALRTPDTIYHYARPGIGLRLALDPSWSLDLGGGYRYITNKGGPQISGSFFPRLAVAGADANVAITYAFSDIYALRGGIDWRRYWYDFHSRMGDTFVAGGAVDQSFLFSLSLVLTLGSSAHAEAEAAPAPAKGKADKAKSDDGGGESGGGSDEGGGDGGGKKSGGSDEL